MKKSTFFKTTVFIIAVIVSLSGCSVLSNFFNSNTEDSAAMNTTSKQNEQSTSVNADSEITTTENSNVESDTTDYGTNISEAETAVGFAFSDELPKIGNVRIIDNKIIEVQCARADYNDDVTDGSSVYLRKAVDSSLDEEESLSGIDEDDLSPVMSTAKTGGTYLCDSNGNIIVVNFSDSDYIYSIYCGDDEQGMEPAEAEYLMEAMLGTAD